MVSNAAAGSLSSHSTIQKTMGSLVHCFRLFREKRSTAKVAPDSGESLFSDQRGSEKALRNLQHKLTKLRKLADKEYSLFKEYVVLKETRDQFSAPCDNPVLTTEELEEARLWTRAEKALIRAEKRLYPVVMATSSRRRSFRIGFYKYVYRFGLTPGIRALGRA